MSRSYSEDKLVQENTATFLKGLGWETAVAFDAETLGPNSTFGRLNQKEVVLNRHTLAALRQLNPGHPERVYHEALQTLLSVNSAQTLVSINQQKYDLIREGIPISYRIANGQTKDLHLRLFDFANPRNNHFLAIRELWIQGEFGPRRPDILGYVNGLPLLFIECKNIHKSLKTAYNVNLTNYKEYIPQILYHNAFIILGNGLEGRIGSLTSRYQYFHLWQRLDETTPSKWDYQTLLQGVCEPTNFIDLLENFILFDNTSGETRKIIARNHQFLGVNRAFAATQERDVRQGKLGVFWHTQGSGKSYSMAFLARKIHRKLPGSFTFLVLTDREDLDNQIYKTFVNIGAVNEKEAGRATSGAKLKELLQQNPRYVFSLIHKFNQPVDMETPYTTNPNIIVFSDEAHRTQYGLFARNMRAALPGASYIGFTGTPLIGGPDDALTKETFGDYVSTYDFRRAIEDAATVPLFYDNRGEKLELITDKLNEKMADVLEVYAPNEDEGDRLRRILASDYLLVTKPERLDRIAQDFVSHYTERWQTGKAMLVCLDKITAVKMHDLIATYWQQAIKKQKNRLIHLTDEQQEAEEKRFLAWLEETERLVVVSESADEVHTFAQWGLDIAPHRTLMKNRNLEEEFKKADHPFRVAIVCAMWLTGFDVESLATLYIDKPMKSHTLMQAIARANRVAEGKSNGLIVDYNGLLKSLRKALATYASGVKPNENQTEPDPAFDPALEIDDLLQIYATDIQACTNYLLTLGYNLQTLLNAEGFDKATQVAEAAEKVAINDTSRAKYEVLAQEVFKKARSLSANPGLPQYKPQHDALDAIYKQLQKSDDDPADIIEVLRALSKTVDETVRLNPSRSLDDESLKTYDISKIDFDILRAEFEHSSRKNTTVQTIKQKVEKKLNRLIKQNPLRLDFYQRYQTIIEAYNAETDRATIEKTFEELLHFIQSLSEEEVRHSREGLSEEHLTAFDLLSQSKNNLSPATRERLKGIAGGLIEVLKAKLAEIENWTDKESTKSQVKTLIHDYLYDENTGLPITDYTTDEVAMLAEEFFQYVYQQYPDLQTNIFVMSDAS